eukprot:RCo048872
MSDHLYVAPSRSLSSNVDGAVQQSFQMLLPALHDLLLRCRTRLRGFSWVGWALAGVPATAVALSVLSLWWRRVCKGLLVGAGIGPCLLPRWVFGAPSAEVPPSRVRQYRMQLLAVGTDPPQHRVTAL